MADDIRIVLDPVAVADLLTDPGVGQALMEAGQAVAGAAQSGAPHRTGAGAASIQPRMAGPGEVDVGWDSDHHYMFFHEFGTRYMSAAPFLGPALDYAHL